MKSEIDASIVALDDYVRGHLADDLVPDYEEDLFARALSKEAPELEFREGIGQVLRVMRARWTLNPWLKASEVEGLLASGLRVIRFDMDPEHPVPPDLSGEFDILLTRVPVDLTGVRRLDAEVFAPNGKLLKVMPEIPFDPAEGAVYACCEAELARASASVPSVTRVWATDDSGRRLLGEIRSV